MCIKDKCYLCGKDTVFTEESLTGGMIKFWFGGKAGFHVMNLVF